MTLRLSCSYLFAMLAGLCAPALAGAQILAVGIGCPYPDLQPAVNAAPTSGAEIHLLNNLTNQHVTIAGKSLSIIGGFTACGDASPAPNRTNLVSAGSHTDDSVITISGAANVVLKNLIISDGKENDAGYGGGIDFVGHGSLVLDHVQVTNNRAGYGGGINMSPNGTTALRLQNSTWIMNNTGTISGGGVRIEGDTHLYMLDGGTTIFANSTLSPSDGHGGGLQVIGPAVANIGSASVSGNLAQYGGGIYLEGGARGGGVARLFRTSSRFAASITNNKASKTGGGVFLEGADDTYFGYLCGNGYDISGNSAQEGSAIYADTGDFLAGYVQLTRAALDGQSCDAEPAVNLGAVDCPTDQPCNRIDGNIAQTISGAATDGAAVTIQSQGTSSMEMVQISHNRGGYAFRGFSRRPVDPPNEIDDCLINDNVLTKGVVRTDEEGPFTMRRCTVAGNTLGADARIFVMPTGLALSESILWAPGTLSLSDEAMFYSATHVMSNDVSTLGLPRPDVVAVADPKFRNPSQGDYRLTPASPAVDFTVPPAGTVDFDLDHRPRIVGLIHPEHALDLGAYELQTLLQFPPDETFDELTPPRRPDGWGQSRTGGGLRFFTVADISASPPNALYTDDPAVVSDKMFWTPEFTVVAKGRVTFKQRVVLEAGDGVRLEIAIGAGQQTYREIIEAGGHFVTGGYNATMHGNGNPLESSSAWSGDSGGFQTVTVDLPRDADGQAVKLKWNLGTDAGGGSQPSWGYWLDDIHVDLDGRPADRIFCDGLEGHPCD